MSDYYESALDAIDRDRDAEIVRHTACVWHDLRTNGRAREAGTNRPLPHMSAVMDLTQRLFDTDPEWIDRATVHAANAEKGDALKAWYENAIVHEVRNAVRRAVKAEAESREANEERA